MERYEIKSLSDNKRNNDNLPREGLVTEVCREWSMHEDQALAYRLQSEEYQHHLGHNRHRNALLRTDTPRAKEEQLREDEEAARAQTLFEMELAEQERRDANLAAAIGAQLDRKEEEKRRLQELKDRQLAKKIVDEEKTKIRQVKEVRQVEREAAYLGINSGLDNVAILSRKDKRSSVAITNDACQNKRAVSPNSDDLSDLSDFCIQPSSSMDEDEMKKLQENQDEELARLLQEQDLKRRGDLLQEDQLLAIEAQDKELAKILQEQEKAKAKKAREKARQKALKQQQEEQQQRQQDSQSYEQEQIERSSPPPPIRPPKPMTPPSRETSPHLGESPQYAALLPQRSNSPQYATPMLVRGSSTSSSEGNSPLKNSSERMPRGGDRTPPTYTTLSAFPNIACAIDPTYERRVKQGELSPSSTLSSPHHLASPSGSSKSPVSPPVFEEEEEEEEEEDVYLPPPYMPIQGQRRTASLEKRQVTSKPQKEKAAKNGCTQQ